MLREEANMVTEYLEEGGFLTEELTGLINESVDDDFYQLINRDELQDLVGYSIVSVIDTSDERGRPGSLIILGKLIEGGCKNIRLLLSGSGNIYMSKEV